MKKMMTVGFASTLAALALTAGSMLAQGRGGQTPAPAPAPAQDLSQVQIKTTKIGPSFYTLGLRFIF